MTYEVLGFTKAGDVLFLVNDEYVNIKGTLPKADLCFKLGIDAADVDKYLRNDILNKAKEGGLFIFKCVGNPGKERYTWLKVLS